MVKKPLDLRGGERLPSLRNQLYFSEWRGTIRISRWPRKRRGKPSPRMAHAQDLMKQASAAIKRMDGGQIATAKEISLALLGVDSPVPYHDGEKQFARRQKTQGLWRDILFASLYGRTPVILDTDVGKFWPVTALSDVSELLNVLGVVPGTILVRGDEYWSKLLPGNPGEVLTISPLGKLEWSPGGGASATGKTATMFRDDRASTSAHATKGTWFTPVVDLDIHEIFHFLSVTDGAIYRACLARLNGFDIDAVLEQTATKVGVGTGVQTMTFPLSTPQRLEAGNRYFIGLTRTDATDTTSCGARVVEKRMLPGPAEWEFGNAVYNKTSLSPADSPASSSSGDIFSCNFIYSVA